MSAEPKPATGEWTVNENWNKEGTIAELQCGEGDSIKVVKSENPALFHAIRYLKRLHNAALAAEGEKREMAILQYQVAIRKLREQLAAKP